MLEWLQDAKFIPSAVEVAAVEAEAKAIEAVASVVGAEAFAIGAVAPAVGTVVSVELGKGDSGEQLHPLESLMHNQILHLQEK